MNRIGLLAVAALAAVASAPAAAEQNPFARDEAVLRLNDLDLGTVDGQQRLALRMDSAARAVCGDRLATVHLDAAARSRTCREEVLADIRARVESRMAAATAAKPVQLASAR